MYLDYRTCLWVFVRDGMTPRIQRYQRLRPEFPEFWYWEVRHLGVHSASPLLCLFFPHSAAQIRGKLRRFTYAKRELTVNTLNKVKSIEICPTHISFKSLNPMKICCS
jgi:hypothetical protein